MHRASKEEPQYEIQSDETDHVAMHKGAALNKLKEFNGVDVLACAAFSDAMRSVEHRAQMGQIVD